MKITALETILLDEFPNVLWVQVHTDEGLSGLGETYFGAQAVAAFVHETAAPLPSTSSAPASVACPGTTSSGASSASTRSARSPT